MTNMGVCLGGINWTKSPLFKAMPNVPGQDWHLAPVLVDNVR